MSKLGKASDGIVSRYINRRVSSAVTRFILKHNIQVTPNQITVIVFLIGAAAAPLYVIGAVALAGVLVQLSSILDGVDGELARARGLTSRFGAFLDTMLDRFVDVLALFGAYLYLELYSSPTLLHRIIAVSALTFSLLTSYLHAAFERDLRVKPQVVGKVRPFASRDMRLLLLAIGSVGEEFFRGCLLASLAVIALISALYVVVKFIDLAIHGRYVEKALSQQQQASSP